MGTETLLDTSAFLKLVAFDFRMHMLKRLAYINSEGHPPENILNDPRHLYVIETSDKLMKVKNAIDHAKLLIKQIEIVPSQDWLESIGITKYEFIQQNVDLFSVVLFSSLDRALLLANFLMNLIGSEKEVTYKKIIGSIRKQRESVADLLTELYKETADLADHRNFFSHRGKNRNAGRVSSIRRIKVITQLFNVPMDNTVFLDDEAEKELAELLRKEVSLIEPILLKFLESVSSIYIEGINKIGGIDMPNEEELSRAALAIEYFNGGTRPEFMASSS